MTHVIALKGAAEVSVTAMTHVIPLMGDARPWI